MEGRYRLHGTPVPFSATRQLLDAVLDDDARLRLNVPLRPITHQAAHTDASLSDRQIAHEQIRFYTRLRCMRDFRLVAKHLAACCPEGSEIAVTGFLNRADLDFLSVLTSYWDVHLTIRPDNWDEIAPDHPDARRIRAGLRTDGDWRWLKERLRGYVNAGDSWTAAWLADAVLRGHLRVPPTSADIIGIAYGLQERTSDAELLYRRWREAGGIDLARANYSLAMLYARHHPMALRNDETAAALLEEAWEVLRDLDASDEHVFYERVFNRNGIALILYRQKRYDEAISLLEVAIKGLSETRFGRGVHHTVLANNLGRVYAAAGDPVRAERYLRSAIDIDPMFAEYWFDLASFYADEGRIAEAIEAATIAESRSTSIADIPALLGYIVGRTGDHEGAVDAYQRAWDVEPGHVQAALGIAHHLCELGRYPEAQPWFARLHSLTLSSDQRETLDLLILEADLNAQPPLAGAELVRRVDELAARYPDSATVQGNRELLLSAERGAR
jgi:tetratricopeptide (TPR) repeat protein